MSEQSPQPAPAAETLRVFTGVKLPGETIGKVGDLLARLQKGAAFTGSHPTWVAAENVHITLVFLGAQSAERIPELKEAADEAVRGLGAFSLRLGGLHLFPNPKEPRVISLGLSGDLEKLNELRERLAAELRGRGFPVEARPFRPHVTLARIKSVRGVSGLRDLLASHQRIEPGRFPVDRLTVFQSTMTSQGSIYTVLHEARLQPETGPADGG